MVEPGAGEYVPAAHGVHVVEAIEEEYVPAGQNEHVDTEVAPITLEYVPATQLLHVEFVEAPTVAEYLPALHSEHSDNPITPANVPAGHGVLTPFAQ